MEFTRWRRETGNNFNLNAQNIYSYFESVSSDGVRRYRHVVIKEWMEKNNIEKIKVMVCPFNK